MRRHESLGTVFDTSSVLTLLQLPERPAVDEQALWDMLMGMPLRQAALVAFDLGVFTVLSPEALPLGRIAEALDIEVRSAQALVSACAVLGLVCMRDGLYELTAPARQYLADTSATSFASVLEVAGIMNGHTFSFETVRSAVLSGRPQVEGGRDLVEAYVADPAGARALTRMWHGHSIGPALAWADVVDLAEHRHMLDIGGGSGIHAIAATRAWPGLCATVVERSPVCPVAREYIKRYRAEGRVSVVAGDLWRGVMPAADVHVYGDVFHAWPVERCRALAQRSLEHLPRGGRIVVHEMLLDDDKSGPPAVVGYNVAMLVWTEGQQLSGAELADIVEEAGFVGVEVLPTFGDWGVVTGRKP